VPCLEISGSPPRGPRTALPSPRHRSLLYTSGTADLPTTLHDKGQSHFVGVSQPLPPSLKLLILQLGPPPSESSASQHHGLNGCSMPAPPYAAMEHHECASGLRQPPPTAVGGPACEVECRAGGGRQAGGLTQSMDLSLDHVLGILIREKRDCRGPHAVPAPGSGGRHPASASCPTASSPLPAELTATPPRSNHRENE